MRIVTVMLLSFLSLYAAEQKFLLKVKGTEIVLNNASEERFFVMGLVDNNPRYGRKLSDKYWPDKMDARLENFSNTGANTMRWNAFYFGRDFLWDDNGYVSGLVEGGFKNLRDCLDKAQKHKIFVQIVLSTAHFQNIGDGDTKLHNGTTNADRVNNIHKMLTTEEGYNAYKNNILIPMIDSIGVHPALFGFLLGNELHGMTEVPVGSKYKSGWADQLVPEADLQKFFNRVSGELHRRLPGVICGISLTAKRRNQYTSETLIAAGGDTDGVLDIYQLQYYPGDHTLDESPFDLTLSGIADAALDGDKTIDKPVIAGEFWADGIREGKESSSNLRYTPTEAYERLWNNSYSGGFGWGSWQYETDQWDAWAGKPATLASIDSGYAALRDNHLSGVDPWDTAAVSLELPSSIQQNRDISITLNNRDLQFSKALKNNGVLSLLSVNGRVLFSQQITRGVKTISLGNSLSKGVYLVQLKSEKDLIQAKINLH